MGLLSGASAAVSRTAKSAKDVASAAGSKSMNLASGAMESSVDKVTS